MVRQLCRMIMGRDEKILKLAQEYMALEDFLELGIVSTRLNLLRLGRRPQRHVLGPFP
jgi:hypothetical protein